jgi:hypothetical protein
MGPVDNLAVFAMHSRAGQTPQATTRSMLWTIFIYFKIVPNIRRKQAKSQGTDILRVLINAHRQGSRPLCFMLCHALVDRVVTL